MNSNANERTKQELLEIWTDGKAIASTLIVVIPLILYILYKAGLFDTQGLGTWTDIKYIITGPLFFFVGVAYAPVWITCSIYLIYLIFKFIFTVLRIMSRAADRMSSKEPRTMTREELINKLKE
jgi:hypothetical protein